MSRGVRVLVIEDGREYTELLGRFLPGRFDLVRAGSGPEALALLARAAFDVVFLDMRFDRAPAERLLGDLAALAARFGGDRTRARRHLEAHQGTYVLAALRAAGHRLPVVFSYDFDREPRRWAHIRERQAPVSYLPDDADPATVARHLEAVLTPRPAPR